MRQYTTPTYTLKISGISLLDCDVYVTFSQGAKIVTIEDPEVSYADDATTIEVSLTQEQTAKFNSSAPATVQVNWITSNGKRNATNTKQVPVLVNTLKEVIEYGG